MITLTSACVRYGDEALTYSQSQLMMSPSQRNLTSGHKAEDVKESVKVVSSIEELKRHQKRNARKMAIQQKQRAADKVNEKTVRKLRILLLLIWSVGTVTIGATVANVVQNLIATVPKALFIFRCFWPTRARFCSPFVCVLFCDA
jgi:hypothetical protein